MYFDYWQICQDLLEGLPKKQKKVISRRFALFGASSGNDGAKRETLASIGKELGITRERVRQIEKDGMARMEPRIAEHQKIFQYFVKYFKKAGGLKQEVILLEQLGSKRDKRLVYFLLSLGQNFKRYGESADFYSLWTINQNSLILAEKVIDFLLNKLKKAKKPLTLKELGNLLEQNLKTNFLISYLEISKKIQQNKDGLFGLKDWPEINPKRIKDRAYLVLKENNAPLHFNQVARLIGEDVLPQTVHNELIKDQKFVLVGRGIYALKDWGYYPGDVKAIIFKSLKETNKPLTKEEILEKVLKQRLVKENTILLNLNNKKYFLRTSEGKYKTKIA